VSALGTRLYDLVLERTERAGLTKWRCELLAPLQGRVLEIGAGTGHNLPFYPSAVTELVLVEPDRHMRRRLAIRMRELHIPVAVVPTGAETLPYPDATFDAVVITLVLCSVRDPAAVLSEVRRVLCPSGKLIVIEHVGAEPASRVAELQTRIEPLWRRLAGNCHLTRDTAAQLGRAGFDTSTLLAENLPSAPSLIRSAVRGSLGLRPADHQGSEPHSC